MWKHNNFINLQLCAVTLSQLNDINVFVDGVLTTIGADYSGTPGVTPSITIAENKITSTATSFYNITENNYASASSDSKELLIKDGWKIKYVEYPYIVGDGGTLYNVGDSFNATGAGNGLYITLEQSGGGSTMKFKHFYDAGLQGTGAIKFRHYSQQEPSSGETWVLNETVNISGTNYYNNIEMTYSGQTRAYPIRSLKMYEYSDGPETAYNIYGEEESEYKEGNSKYGLYSTGGGATGWQLSQSGTAFNTWYFATAPTGDLLTWLQANGVKQ